MVDLDAPGLSEANRVLVSDVLYKSDPSSTLVVTRVHPEA